MTTKLSEFEQFIVWFTELDDPSVDIFEKKQFLDHILEVGDIDEKAAQYISHILEKLEKNERTRAKEILERINGLKNIQQGQKIPELSLTHKITETEGQKMLSLAEKFVEGVMAKSRSLEASEHKQEASEVANLKSAL